MGPGYDEQTHCWLHRTDGIYTAKSGYDFIMGKEPAVSGISWLGTPQECPDVLSLLSC